MARVGCNLGQGFQHEAALVHGGMGNRQSGRVHTGVAEKQNVDIDGARPLWLDASPTHSLLDFENSLQQLVGRHVCVEGEGAVQEPWLIGELDGFGFIERRCGGHSPEAAQFLDSGMKVSDAVSNIRA